MTKTELESKHLAELHALAAEAGIDRYRMLPRAELIERLAGGAGGGEPANGGGDRKPQGDRPKRRRRRSGSKRPQSKGEGREDQGSEDEKDEEPEAVEPASPPPAEPVVPAATGEQEAARPKRRRRRRFGRRKEGVALTSLLLPPEPGRQTVLCAETREACTALLRGVAADLAGAAKGPDPIALLIDPSPEELADWKREAPQAEIVAAGQARHADDALAAAVRRAGSGEDVILLIDSLNRLGEAHGDAEAAKEFFDSGRAQGAAGGGSLTVVAALERSA